MTNMMTRQRVVEIITAARARGERPNLSYMNLSGLDLSGVDLSGAVLIGTNFRGADLQGADLQGADLRRTNLSGANLSGADLRGANLRGANLSGAVVRQTNLTGTNLRGAVLPGRPYALADLRDADLPGLFLDGLPSGRLVFIPTPEGWHLTIGCWQGTTTELREMIAGNEGWPEAEGEEIAVRRPMLEGMAAACDAYAAANQHDLADVKAAADRWREN